MYYFMMAFGAFGLYLVYLMRNLGNSPGDADVVPPGLSRKQREALACIVWDICGIRPQELWGRMYVLGPSFSVHQDALGEDIKRILRSCGFAADVEKPFSIKRSRLKELVVQLAEQERFVQLCCSSTNVVLIRLGIEYSANIADRDVLYTRCFFQEVTQATIDHLTRQSTDSN